MINEVWLVLKYQIHVGACHVYSRGFQIKAVQGSTPRPVKIPQNSFGPVKKYVNWSYTACKHLETFSLKSFPLRMSPIVFEINEDKIHEDKCCGESYAMFFPVMFKKRCRTSKHFAGPVDAR